MDERLIQKVLSTSYHIQTDKIVFGAGNFDLLITDERMFREHLHKYKELKQQALPVMLPVLLLASDKPSNITDHLIENADDILVMPTSPKMLKTRIELLLRTREYSRKLQVEKRKFQLLAENSTDMISIHNQAGEYAYVSPSAQQVLGYKPEELIGRSAYDFIHERDHEVVQLSREYTMTTGEPCKVEFRKITKNGDVKWVESILKALEIPSKSDEIQLQASTRDISDRKEYEQKLEKEVTFIEAALDVLPNVFFMVDSKLNFIRWNQNLIHKLGYSEKEIKKMSPFELIKEEDHEKVQRKIKEVFASGEAEVEADLVTKKGNIVRHKISGRIFLENGQKYIIGTGVDITDQYKIMNQLKVSNDEKEVLLKEIHHRVKNNLAVISSMLQLQAMESDNAELAEKLGDSQLRIQSIASVHELLYQSESFSHVDMQIYLDKLIHVIQEMNHSDKDISVVQDIDPVKLNINQAIPCSLIANEMITNAFKHAFKGRSDGKIYVTLRKSHNDEIMIIIKDDGNGLAKNVDFTTPNSLGVRLINVLKEQLEGQLEVRSNQGTTFCFTFKKKDSKGSASNYIQR